MIPDQPAGGPDNVPGGQASAASVVVGACYVLHKEGRPCCREILLTHDASWCVQISQEIWSDQGSDPPMKPVLHRRGAGRALTIYPEHADLTRTIDGLFASSKFTDRPCSSRA